MSESSAEKVVELLNRWPTGTVLAADLGLRSRTHVACFKIRGRIPRAYWHDLVASARKHGIPGVSIDLLKEMHANIGQRRS